MKQRGQGLINKQSKTINNITHNNLEAGSRDHTSKKHNIAKREGTWERASHCCGAWLPSNDKPEQDHKSALQPPSTPKEKTFTTKQSYSEGQRPHTRDTITTTATNSEEEKKKLENERKKTNKT